VFLFFFLTSGCKALHEITSVWSSLLFLDL
jgi:hypothetical protein